MEALESERKGTEGGALKTHIMSEQSLKEKTVKGTIWSGIDNIAQYAVSFVVSIVLARLLSPDDYGLIGIIAIFTNICNAIISGGFSSALIRKKEANDQDYNTVFLVNIGMSVLLYSVIFLCSPLIARFFSREELVALTRVSSLTMIIGALAMVQQTKLTKRIDFKTQTKITLIASLTSGVTGIVMAFLGFGVWSLVAQGIVLQILRTALLLFYNKWMPRVEFSRDSFRELFGFGWKLMVVRILDSVWKELYQVVVGRFYNPATLGQYTRAKQFSQLFSSNLTGVIDRVTYPVLSEIQDDKARLASGYRRIIKTTMFIAAVGMLSLGAVSEPLLYCLIGPRWCEAATYLPLICISGSLYPLHAINLNMLAVQGRSDLNLILEIVKKIIALAPLFIGAIVGIMPMLYANLVTSVISFFLNSHWSGKFIGYSSWMQIRDIAPSYGVATVVALSVWFLKYLPLSNWIILPLQVVVGVAVFIFTCKITRLPEYEEAKNMMMPFVKRFKK